jgi:aminomethyltransferase
MATRTAAGLFDVSHMGEIEVRGERALELVQHVTCNDASRLAAGQAQYSGLMNENGGFVDDILVHKFSDTRYFLCVNAGNQDKDFEHICAHNRFGAQVENAGERYSQLAIWAERRASRSGSPKPLLNPSSITVRYRRGQRRGLPDRPHRYTGEPDSKSTSRPNIPGSRGPPCWRPARASLLPCGLGARNTLRLEAACACTAEIDSTPHRGRLVYPGSASRRATSRPPAAKPRPGTGANRSA